MSVTSGMRKNILPKNMPTADEADHGRLALIDGPWLNNFWAVVPHSGCVPRNGAAECVVPDCGSISHTGMHGKAHLCHAHYWQWYRSGRPQDVVTWAQTEAQPPREASLGLGNSEANGIDFRPLPEKVAREIRFVVGTKIQRGDWTPNKRLREVLQCLCRVVLSTAVRSLLERRPEDWELLARQDLLEAGASASFFDFQFRPYFRTFFATLHRALVVDPWAEDLWLWRGMFDQILGAQKRAGKSNVDWAGIAQQWLRDPVKRLARTCLITKSHAWATMLNWAQGLAMLSQFLTSEGIDDPALLDRDLFLDFLEHVSTTRGTKNSLQNVNTVASILERLKADEMLALPTAVYLRRGENAVPKNRMPRPYPDDVVRRIDDKVIADPDIDLTVRTMLRFNRWGGLRISELVETPIDCLRPNTKGGYWVEFFMSKTASWRRFPVPDDLANDLLEQQARVRALYGESSEILFPSRSRSNARAGVVHPWSPAGFRNHVRGLFAKHGITHSTETGEKVSGGEIHRYRHTVGTALLNNQWTQREVQDFLGHKSATMTGHYAAILDETLIKKAKEFHRKQQEERPAADEPQEHPVVEKLRQRIAAVLPDGFCLLPASKKCDTRDNPCTSCTFFDPGGEAFKPVHANHRKQLRLVIAESAGDPAKLALNQALLETVPDTGADDDDEGAA